MKTLVAFTAVLFAVSHAFAASTGITLVQKNPPTETKPVEAKPTDVQPAPPVKPVVKKEEMPKPAKEPVIPGITLARPNGTFLGLEVVGGNFKLSFYDKKKKPMAVDVSRGLARWANTRGPGDNRTPLNPSGMALVGSKPVLPPFVFNVFLTLLQGEDENAKAVETYTVQFKG